MSQTIEFITFPFISSIFSTLSLFFLELCHLKENENPPQKHNLFNISTFFPFRCFVGKCKSIESRKYYQTQFWDGKIREDLKTLHMTQNALGTMRTMKYSILFGFPFSRRQRETWDSFFYTILLRFTRFLFPLPWVKYIELLRVRARKIANWKIEVWKWWSLKGCWKLKAYNSSYNIEHCRNRSLIESIKLIEVIKLFKIHYQTILSVYQVVRKYIFNTQEWCKGKF